MCATGDVAHSDATIAAEQVKDGDGVSISAALFNFTQSGCPFGGFSQFFTHVRSSEVLQAKFEKPKNAAKTIEDQSTFVRATAL